MYCIEFVEPKPGVAQERFQQVVAMSSERWAKNHPDDKSSWNIGEWRLGPRPTYMTVWKIKDVTALEKWQKESRAAQIIENHAQFTDVATIVDAGLFEDLGNEVW